MPLQFTRPSAFELAFRLYERAVHPELFEIYSVTKTAGRNWKASVLLTSAGHVVDFRANGSTVTEVTGPSSSVLPDRGLCLGHRLGGSRDWTVQLGRGLKVHYSAHVESVDAGVFRNLDQELTLDARDAAVSYRFPGGSRFRPGPLSVLQIEALPHSLMLHTFHTFPDNCAVLRTQSLYEPEIDE